MIIKKNVMFDPAKEERTLHIYLPDDYETSEKRYPVMYCFDGHNLYLDEDATYKKSWGFKEFLDSWEKELIMVGIECSHTDRLSEYSPYDNKGGFLGDITGTGHTTLEWMANTLKPMIDKEYRTYSFREATAICGSSMGGIMAIYAGVAFSDTFSKCACISSAISYCMDELAADIAAYEIAEDTKFYLSWGEHEGGPWKVAPDVDSKGAKNNHRVAELLMEKGALTRVVYQPDGNHCEASWELLVPEFMNYFWFNR